ncbi:MAPEG family protein [Paralcaligenes sp. KSB-10]|uniref:MAPEG family protein n=1 Tax=Paralcaligenes sp. KSB-10 TaxID=2901142 RepID=UPI001E54055D|nr:MAPEG family protein [Paralcaligenes sp. KSB-10]UHL65375.1 MAPEG family protein [Paralcaligenes sp. KSB-10]
MKMIAWLMLAAALLPVVAAMISKGGGKGYDNNNPRPWLERQQGWRARANAAQINLFEGLPFFYAAVLFALHANVDPVYLGKLMLAWVIVRLVYLGLYIGGYGALRSLVWGVGIAVNIVILFSAV